MKFDPSILLAGNHSKDIHFAKMFIQCLILKSQRPPKSSWFGDYLNQRSQMQMFSGTGTGKKNEFNKPNLKQGNRKWCNVRWTGVLRPISASKLCVPGPNCLSLPRSSQPLRVVLQPGLSAPTPAPAPCLGGSPYWDHVMLMYPVALRWCSTSGSQDWMKPSRSSSPHASWRLRATLLKRPRDRR